MTNKSYIKKENFWRLIGAFLLAVLLWYLVNGDSSNVVSENINNIPVSVTNESELQARGLVMDNNVSYYVNLHVRGVEANLNLIDQKEITAEIDLSDITEAGTYDQPVVVKGLANSVILDTVTPDTIPVHVQKITDKDYTPTIIAQGKPADGNVVISAVTADKVKLTGGTDVLSKVHTVSGLVEVNGMSEDSSQFSEIHAYDSDGNELSGITCAPSMVEANILIGVTKEVPVKQPEILGSPDNGYTVSGITVTPSDRLIAGKADVISGITSLTTEKIDLTQNKTDASFTTTTNINLPDGVSLVNGNKEVSATVNIEQVIEKSYTVTNLETTDLAAGLKVLKINPGSVSLKVSGTATALNTLDTANLKGTVSLAGKTAGTYTLPVKVSVNAGTVKSVSPTQVEVTIEKDS